MPHGKYEGKCGFYASAPMLAGKKEEELYLTQLEDALECQAMLQKRFPTAEISILYHEYADQSAEFYMDELVSIEPLAASA
jgi:hypothetical protein